MIKHLHFIWAGPPMPERFRDNLCAWRDLHPDWDLTLWGDDDLRWLKNRDLYDAAGDYVPDHAIWQMRSDIARYEILEKYGGFYADVDTHPFRNIEPAIEGASLWAVRESRNWFGNTYLYSDFGHRVMAKIIEDIPRRVATTKPGHPSRLTGPVYITPILRRYRCAEGETSQWYPTSWKQARSGLESDVPSEAYAMHEWFHIRRLRGHI